MTEITPAEKASFPFAFSLLHPRLKEIEEDLAKKSLSGGWLEDRR